MARFGWCLNAGLFCSLGLLQAMEFGVMGNVSASMGGAGVALKSPFALYYNPALIAVDSRTRIGYSLGLGMEQSNLDRLTKLDFGKMVNALTSLGAQMGGVGGGGAGGGGAPGGGGGQTDGFQKVLVEALQQTTGQANEQDLEKLWTQYEQKHPNGNHSDLVGKLGAAIDKSNMPQDQKDLLKDLGKSINWDNFDISGGKITHLTIKAGSNGVLDEAMGNLDTLFEVLRNNNMNVRSQSGLTFQLSSEKLGGYGSMAIGIFNSLQAGVSLVADPNRMRLIFGDANGYYELTQSGDGYSLKPSTQSDYDKYSLLKSIQDGNAHKLASSIFSLVELPLGYAYNFKMGRSQFSLGTTIKMMLGLSVYHEQFLSNNIKINTNFASNLKYAINVGVDVGAYYGYSIFDDGEIGLGFVAKNVNFPTFRFDGSPTVVIKPQYRAGLAYNGKNFSLAFDADILPNEVINWSNRSALSQVLGGGFKVDLRYVDLRGGVAYDLRQDSGVIVTAGINILGFLDLAAEVGTKWVNYFGWTAPKYATVRLGGSFSW